MDVTPFSVKISNETLKDLQERLMRTRWPDEIPGSGWDYGSNLDYMKDLVGYWRTQFDWRQQERAINAFSHFRTTIDGLGIHFIHELGKGPNSIPLIITHGWPGSFYELLKIIPLLTDPVSHGGDPLDSFDVVVPSMPGYGFSDNAARSGVNVVKIADLWASLMTEGLGYHRYGAQGGDFGAIVTARLGLAYPDKLMGIHVNSVAGIQHYAGPRSPELSEREKLYLEQWESWLQSEGGYFYIQGTKPQSLAYGLNDSPAGLAAWIVEKFKGWSDCEGAVEHRFTKDELLTNITIYWVTETMNSSSRLYYEFLHNPWVFNEGERIRIPCGIALFPKDTNAPPREWVERSYDVHRWTEMPQGGHFAALEEPELLVEDVRAFFRMFR